MKIVHILLRFVVTCIITIVSACVLQTQMVILELSKLDVVITINDRLYMTWQDILGLFPTYGVVIAIGLAIGFALTKIVLNYTAAKSPFWYVLAAGVSMFVILLAMQPVLGVTLLAGARSGLGLSLQVLSGLLGGFCFIHFPRTSPA